MHHAVGAMTEPAPDRVDKKIGPQMGVGKSHRLDGAFDQLMPGEMGMRGIISRQSTQMNDMADTSRVCGIEQAL